LDEDEIDHNIATAFGGEDRESVDHSMRQARKSLDDSNRKERLLRRSMAKSDIEMKD
jgi:hypothetical protein